jgi:hypothetical protein
MDPPAIQERLQKDAQPALGFVRVMQSPEFSVRIQFRGRVAEARSGIMPTGERGTRDGTRIHSAHFLRLRENWNLGQGWLGQVSSGHRLKAQSDSRYSRNKKAGDPWPPAV